VRCKRQTRSTWNSSCDTIEDNSRDCCFSYHCNIGCYKSVSRYVLSRNTCEIIVEWQRWEIRKQDFVISYVNFNGDKRKKEEVSQGRLKVILCFLTGIWFYLHKMILPWSYRSKLVAEAKYLVFNTLDTWIFWPENTKQTTFLRIESSEFFYRNFLSLRENLSFQDTRFTNQGISHRTISEIRGKISHMRGEIDSRVKRPTRSVLQLHLRMTLLLACSTRVRLLLAYITTD